MVKKSVQFVTGITNTFFSDEILRYQQWDLVNWLDFLQSKWGEFVFEWRITERQVKNHLLYVCTKFCSTRYSRVNIWQIARLGKNKVDWHILLHLLIQKKRDKMERRRGWREEGHWGREEMILSRLIHVSLLGNKAG